jgi:hypothetical protein
MIFKKVCKKCVLADDVSAEKLNRKIIFSKKLRKVVFWVKDLSLNGTPSFFSLYVLLINYEANKVIFTFK